VQSGLKCTTTIDSLMCFFHAIRRKKVQGQLLFFYLRKHGKPLSEEKIVNLL